MMNGTRSTIESVTNALLAILAQTETQLQSVLLVSTHKLGIFTAEIALKVIIAQQFTISL